MRFLRSNTAVIVTVGPFYDKTDGVTIETALTITNERITLTADTDGGSAPTNILDNVTGATSGTANDLNYITGNDAGMMQLELAAADVNRVGRMFLSITDAANHVPVFHEFFVLPQAIYDWFTGVIVPLPANMTQILGTAVSTPATAGILDVNLKNIANAAVSTSTAQLGVNAVQAGGTAWGSGAITAASIAADAITAAKIADGAIDAATLATGTITAAKFAAGAIDAAAIAADAITAAKLAADVTTELQTGLATAANLATVAGYIDTEVASILAAVDTEVAAIKAVTDLLPDAGALTSMATQASVNTIDDFLDTEIAAIKAKTDNLPSDPADQSVLAGLIGTPAGVSLAADVAAVKADTAATLDDTGTSGVVVAAASKTGYRLSATGVADILASALTEAYAADGAAPTLSQILFLIQQALTEFAISGTTISVKKLDGTTEAATFTLDSSTAPTSRTRAT
jgi:hypothetical protein